MDVFRFHEPSKNRHRLVLVVNRHGGGRARGDETALGGQGNSAAPRWRDGADKRVLPDTAVLSGGRRRGLHLHRAARLLHQGIAEGDEDDEHGAVLDHALVGVLPE